MIFVLLFAGCVQEEEMAELEQEVIVEIDAIRQGFEKGELNSLRENLENQMRFKVAPNVEALKKEIEWDKYLVHATKSGRKAYEFSLKYEKSLVPKSVLEGQEEWSGERLFISERVLFFPEGEDDYRIGIFKFYASGNNVNLNEQDFLQQFNVKHQSSELGGLIEEYSWEEEFLKGYQIKNGEFTHTRKRISKEERDFLNSANIQICSGYLVEYCTIYSVVGTNPGGSSWSLFQYMGDCLEKEEGVQCLFQEGDNPWPDDEPLQVGGPGGGDGPPKSDFTNCCFDPITGLIVECEQELEEQIDMSALSNCHHLLINTLIGSTKEEFKKIFEKFEGNSLLVDMNFNVKIQYSNEGTATAWTNPKIENNFANIYIHEGNNTGATDLSLGRTVMHEMLHAYLSFIKDFPQTDRSLNALLNAYIDKYNVPGNIDYNAAHHNLFVEGAFINDIAEELKNFASALGYTSLLSDAQFFKDMAWGGLHTTDVYKKMSDTERTRIERRYYAELNGSTYKGTTPKGKINACPKL